MTDALWGAFLIMISLIAGYALRKRLEPSTECSVDDWQRCMAERCASCEYRELLKAREGDLAAVQEDIKRLAHRNKILWGYLQKYNQKRSAA